ncbi:MULTISPECIES: hypothetical protein [Methylomonas]|uniref:Uncharacterized protein n=2 Tax=Methylomonas TaxID=416 RepID=A0A140E4X6_9GAMM|nr:MULTISPECIES: hypothetical protein [Methylomonas]AMK75450.1 hypothetical protein JT25_002915 [Methylomonas denitrificans]OAI07314.1 hypothetical protein A1342_19710 [Methylomonas methanica]TCV71709.1 hypothetical protein EDE11_1612 [Methylomonas methanica]
MKEIKFKIYHPSIDIVSDRTFRSLLKTFSSLIREVQYQEVIYLINHSELLPSEKQSLRDRLKGPLNHIPAYYVEKIERGSIVIEVSVSAMALWLLKNTIGESVKEAWKQSEMHKSIVAYLSGSDERKRVIDKNIDMVFDAWKFDAFIVENIEKEELDDDTFSITVNLNTSPLLEEHIKENVKKVDTHLVIEEIQKEINRLSNED